MKLFAWIFKARQRTPLVALTSATRARLRGEREREFIRPSFSFCPEENGCNLRDFERRGGNIDKNVRLHMLDTATPDH
jgi:hypothetical protein